jgi:hypothetical protein
LPGSPESVRSTPLTEMVDLLDHSANSRRTPGPQSLFCDDLLRDAGCAGPATDPPPAASVAVLLAQLPQLPQAQPGILLLTHIRDLLADSMPCSRSRPPCHLTLLPATPAESPLRCDLASPFPGSPLRFREPRQPAISEHPNGLVLGFGSIRSLLRNFVNLRGFANSTCYKLFIFSIL